MARRAPFYLVPTPEPEVAEVRSLRAPPMQLKPIAWGKPDKQLARVLFGHMGDANPPIEIPFNPLTDARVRQTLKSLGIHS